MRFKNEPHATNLQKSFRTKHKLIQSLSISWQKKKKRVNELKYLLAHGQPTAFEKKLQRRPSKSARLKKKKETKSFLNKNPSGLIKNTYKNLRAELYERNDFPPPNTLLSCAAI